MAWKALLHMPLSFMPQKKLFYPKMGVQESKNYDEFPKLRSTIVELGNGPKLIGTGLLCQQ